MESQKEKVQEISPAVLCPNRPNANLIFTLVENWGRERGLLNPDNVQAQSMKVMEELGELIKAILKKDPSEQIDGIGDVIVTVILLSRQLGYDALDCLYMAYMEIQNREGKLVDGTFIKNS